MPKSSFEKALEKHQREARKIAEQEARRQRANAVVSGQPFVGGMRIMDSSAEEVLSVIQKLYDGNEQHWVRGSINDFPPAYHDSLLAEFEKLKMYGVVSSTGIYITGEWELTLTSQGITYFDDKSAAEEKEAVAMQNNAEEPKKKYDVFISHANQDKLDYVDSLYVTIRRLGINIFYDSEVISWGDNWKQTILDGTAQSEFAIIIISENFFGREWTERELEELLKRQNETGQKIVLPLLHNISLDMLKEKYPSLGDIQVIDTSRLSKEGIAILFAKELIKRLR